MEVRKEKQLNSVGDDVLALTAVIRQILTGVLNALKMDVVAEAGGHEQVKHEDASATLPSWRRRHRNLL